MPPDEHMELAAFLSAHGGLLVRERQPVPLAQLNGYWTMSRARFERWMQTLKRLESGAQCKGRAALRQAAGQAVIQQILASEAPARVWTAVVAACDRRCGTGDGEPIARSVLCAHQDARCRALQCLLHSPGVPSQEAVALNRLRRQVERWTDLLIGYLAQEHNVAEFAALPERAREFAKDFRERPSWRPGQAAWRMLLASLRNRSRWPHSRSSAMDERLDAAVAWSMLDCFPPQHVSACALNRTLWLHHFDRAADETHSMLEELCRLEFPAS